MDEKCESDERSYNQSGESELTTELSKKLFFCFSQCWRGIMSNLRHLELKPAELALINTLVAYEKEHAQGAMKASQLSRKMQVTQPTITQIISNLEKKGFITRTPDEEDRRAIQISVTKKGRDSLSECTDSFNGKLRALINDFGEEKTRTLINLLQETAYYFNESDEEEK